MFNALLLLLPVFAARVIVETFAQRGFGDTPTVLALTQTRANIDDRFSSLLGERTDADLLWADAIDRQLETGNLDAAKGFMIAAPTVLSRDRRASLCAAARETVRSPEAGLENTSDCPENDAALADAALIFLPTDVRIRYERLTRPVSRTLTATEDMDDVANGTGTKLINPAITPDENPDVKDGEDLTARGRFYLIGTLEDVSEASELWVAEEPVDVFVLNLRAFAHVADGAVTEKQGEAAPFTKEDLARGVSVLIQARRAGRLNADYSERLRNLLDDALPNPPLKERLSEVHAATMVSARRAEAVAGVYADTLDPGPARRLALELSLITRIAGGSSPAAAIELMEFVSNDADLRRLRLLTDAGGTRVLALGTLEGEQVLELATSGIALTNRFYFQIAGLAALALAMLWTVLSAIHHSIFRENAPPEPVL